MSHLIEESKYQEEKHRGVSADRSCTDNIFCLIKFIKTLGSNRKTRLMFVELQMACDNKPIIKLWKLFKGTTIKQTLGSAIQILCHDMNLPLKLAT